MNTAPSAPKLTSELDFWEVTLKTGALVGVRAHSYGESDSWYVFFALMEGEPAWEQELARFPRDVVDEIEGGWSSPRFAAEET